MLIPFKKLQEKYNIRPIGIVHVGASTGQEAEQYYSAGVKRTIWIEAIPDVFAKLKQNISMFPNAIAFNQLITDVNGKEVDFNISSNDGESSSIYEFGTHALEHPNVTFVNKIKLKTTTLFTLLSKNNNVNMLNYDFLNMDIQGAELLALKGLGEKIDFFKYIYLEVNEKELYKGCALVGEIDDYLSKFGFISKECEMTSSGWGDKFYIHKDFISTNQLPQTSNQVQMISSQVSGFNEQNYLNRYPDVADAVKNGMFISGLEHFEKYGRSEGRICD